MPPYLDVYVWVPARDSQILGRFIDSYVNTAASDDRLHVFMRVHVLGSASDTDHRALDELRLDSGRDVITLYLAARNHDEAIITLTRDGATVLGLSVEAPDDLPETLRQAEQLMRRLRQQFSAPAGCAGVELPPAGDRSEWYEEAFVLLRTGELPT
ncbi:hypothetical protein ACIBQX_46075 [Nonomuraea sp. NPDC049714]|uniref:hypothetical protein n=1 Tax=Nonomuraea sp. NPDC049714 TaxID=3364357 RepID=UPI00378D2A63